MLCPRCHTREADFFPVRVTSATLRTTDGVERPLDPASLSAGPLDTWPALCRVCVDEEIDARYGPGTAARGHMLAAAMRAFMDRLPPEMPMAEKARHWQAYLATEEGRRLLRPAT